jgi:helicase
MPLYACVQAWDAASAHECMRAYARAGFDGFAIGGLVPRVRDQRFIDDIVQVVRQDAGNLPIHVFGLGKPQIIHRLFELGVDSVDSSSYVKMAAEGRLWSDTNYRLVDPSVTDRLHLALINLATATERKLPLSTTTLMFKAFSKNDGSLIA